MKYNKLIRDFFERNISAVDIVYKIANNSDTGRIKLKEITETYAIYKFILKTGLKKLKNIVCLDVGCGKYPYLSILLAHLIKSWEFFAIDPQLAIRDYQTKRLNLVKDRVENTYEKIKDRLSDPLVIVCNHAHIYLKDLSSFFKDREVYYITNPCCFDNIPTNVVGYFYKDTRILSPKNIIYLAHFKKGQK